MPRAARRVIASRSPRVHRSAHWCTISRVLPPHRHLSAGSQAGRGTTGGGTRPAPAGQADGQPSGNSENAGTKFVKSVAYLATGNEKAFPTPPPDGGASFLRMAT